MHLDPRVDRAVRLFQYLARVQQVKSQPPRTLDAYERDGGVLWFHSTPDHPAVSSVHRSEDLEPDAPLLVIDRIPRVPPSSPEENLRDWIDGPIDEPTLEPSLLEQVTRPGQLPEDLPADVAADPAQAELHRPILVERLEEHLDVQRAYASWVASWQSWADDELVARPVRDTYERLFSIYLAVTGNPEEFELVAAVGCLRWQPENHLPVNRHLLTYPVGVDFDDGTGQLVVRPLETADGFAVELDMLDPAVIQNPDRINEIRSDARTLDAHPLDRGALGALARRLVHCLDPSGQYQDTDQPVDYQRTAAVAFAPALILRKRSQRGLIEIFRTIEEQLRRSGEVPEGLMPLIDPNHVPDPGLSWEDSAGALLAVDDDWFLPMPVNEAQLKVVHRVDAAAQTLVQGPPGTGKTHTAAALISHLLARGKRVLVTAQTDQALKEVRGKLPDSVKPLSVAVVGASRDDMADLKMAVNRIAQHADEHDPERTNEIISSGLNEIERLRRERADVYRCLIEAREVEVRQHSTHGYSGTLAAIAQEHKRQAALFEWLASLVDIKADDQPPLTNQELGEWRGYLCDEALMADEPEAGQQLLDPVQLRTPEEFADLVEVERATAAAWSAYAELQHHEAFAAVSELETDTRRQLRLRLSALADETAALLARQEQWISAALNDVRGERTTSWRARQHQLTTLIEQAKPLVDRLGPLVDIRTVNHDPAELVPIARAVVEYLQAGGKLRTDLAGRPKLGPLTNKVIKQAASLFDSVLVDNMAPTTVARLEAFLVWAEASRVLAALDSAWPDYVDVSKEDTLGERLHWHINELEQLNRVLRLGRGMEAEELLLSSLGVARPDWNDLEQVRAFADLVDAVAAREAQEQAASPLATLAGVLGEAVRWGEAAPCVARMEQAVRSRDSVRYREAYRRLLHLLEQREVLRRRNELADRLRGAAPRLFAAISGEPVAERWDSWLPTFADAWAWAASAAWIEGHQRVDVNRLQARLRWIEDEIRCNVERLAVARAWSHAVSPDRMTGEARADLQNYVYLVRRLGKGTGRYAAQRRSEVRVAMDRCRPSVPVWILPIYRIAEQLRVAPNMFDVVIVDEASQAGVEATFLQYLAPKIVVIGDDKQVSPTAVGVEEQQLRDLAAQYLYDDPYRSLWQDPRRSLFDEAKTRYGDLITLVEHRRCVPEIIGFSNRVAYEPDGIRLIPVRQYGADRLEPIKLVHLPDGYIRGDSRKINPVEVQAIVEQIEKCMADPAYDALTFGVISLLGMVQAKAIEKALLERIPPQDWSARELRCGDSATFQGSERNVMFLSMVEAPAPGRRIMPLTQEMYLQRYNVAASRAKDQLWLFHSLDLNDLGRPDDLRFQLLDYCYGVTRRTARHEASLPDSVPEDVRVSPFDSLFEQRVFNRVIDRGYTVIPQYEVEHYRIDLVVVGAHAKLAIECDGDAWHGPDRYEADLARQRDLERCDWSFFRIPESSFNIDPAAALRGLWETLEKLDIHPSGWVQSAPPSLPTDLPSPPHPGIGEQPQQLPSATTQSPIPSAVPNPTSRQSAGSPQPTSQSSGSQMDDPKLDPEESLGALVAVGANHESWPDQKPEREGEGKQTGSRSTEQLRPPSAQGLALAPYEQFQGRTTPVIGASREQLIEGLVAVVALEGPVVGERLYQAYIRASGGHRVGKQLARALNSATVAAVRRGLLLEDNPLNEQGVKPKTYRLQAQPLVQPRQLGPRELESLPPRELAHVIGLAAQATGWNDEEALFRATLERLGLKRLTASALTHLRRIRRLAQADLFAQADPEL